jgi:hypothetical protein
MYTPRKFKLAAVMPSWKGPELLAVSIPSILKSFKEDSKLFVILNEVDKESLEICQDYKVDFIALSQNCGTLAVDFVLPWCSCEYFLNINSDMMPTEGFDVDLINNIEKYYPASSSCGLIEPSVTNTSGFFIQDNFEWSEEGYKELNRKFKTGMWNRSHKISWSHPILCKVEDLIKVGGYSGNFDWRFVSGHSNDELFPWRLKRLHSNFKFIGSGTSFVFHLVSRTNKKLPKEFNDRHNMEIFKEVTGITNAQFRDFMGFLQEIK